jgi:hypothetical protein
MLLVGLSAYSQDILGCTDPNASNYNPSATIDNGTCCTLENWATVTTNVNAYIHIWGISNGADEFVYTQANVPFGVCLEDAWDPERSLVEPLGEARRSRRVVP